MLLYLYIVLQLVAALCFEILTQHDKRRTNNQTKQIQIRKSYIRQIIKMLFSEECCEVYPIPNTDKLRNALTESLYTTLSHTYGTDSAIIRELTRRYRLDIFLQQRIKWSRDRNRAHSLMLMSVIPSRQASTQLLQHYLDSHNNDIRTAALLATLAADPSKAIATIASLRFELTPLDIARIISLLRRGLLPIAYEPLLCSSNHNLQMLGLYIVRNFGIEIADKHLQNIISSATNPNIVHEAIYTLSSLGRPLGRTKVRERLSTMTPRRRKQLCRHLTHAGYSLSALRSLFTQDETRYSESIIKSYKRDLICQQSVSTS